MKLLIVDDEPEILSSLKRTLKYKGIERVTTCDQGSKALLLIQKGDFDVVLLDIVMPDMDGLEILASAKPQRPHTEFIIISGVDQIDTAVRGGSPGGVRLSGQAAGSHPASPFHRTGPYERRALTLGFTEMGTGRKPVRNCPKPFHPFEPNPRKCAA